MERLDGGFKIISVLGYCSAHRHLEPGLTKARSSIKAPWSLVLIDFIKLIIMKKEEKVQKRWLDTCGFACAKGNHSENLLND